MSTQAPRHARTGDARTRAAEVLARVEADGAFAAPVLDAALDRDPPLDPRDRALATELVYGVLRSAPALDQAVGRFTKDGLRSVTRLDPWTRALVRVAAYQVMALARVPPSAAINAAVEAVKRSRTPRLAGFVNAVLRRLAGERPAELPEGARAELALRSVPAVARARIAEVLGVEGAERFLRAALGDEAAVVLRVNTNRATREAVIASLQAELPGATVTPGRVSPLAVRVVGGGDPSRSAAVREGLASMQEEGAQCVALMAAVAPGMSVLDACGGRGGKSAVVALGLAGRGVLHAADLFDEKLARLRDDLARQGLDAGLDLRTFAVDLTRGVGALAAAAPAGGYDVALVDAPCSGLGTLGHRPDVLLRLRDEGQWGALAATQRAILETVATRVRVGGVIVYAVCTLTREEGDGVVEGFLAAHPEFARADGDATVPERLRPARVVLDAGADGTDGFMASRLRRLR